MSQVEAKAVWYTVLGSFVRYKKAATFTLHWELCVEAECPQDARYEAERRILEQEDAEEGDGTLTVVAIFRGKPKNYLKELSP